MLPDCLVAVDPDTTAPGVAHFVDGALTRASAMPLEEALHFAATELFSPQTKRAGFVIECPQTYGGRAARGDANDLIALARVVGRFEQAASAARQIRVVTAREWKGQTPKRIMSVRVWQALSEDEQRAAVISAQARRKLDSGEGVESGAASDALDAAGIGLWALGRLGRGRGI